MKKQSAQKSLSILYIAEATGGRIDEYAIRQVPALMAVAARVTAL